MTKGLAPSIQAALRRAPSFEEGSGARDTRDLVEYALVMIRARGTAGVEVSELRAAVRASEADFTRLMAALREVPEIGFSHGNGAAASIYWIGRMGLGLLSEDAPPRPRWPEQVW